MNSLLIAAVVALSTPPPRDPGMLFGDVDDNVLELATLTLGALVALVLGINPWLVALVLPPLLVLHRAVLVGQLEEAAAIDGKTGLLNAHTWGARAEHQLRRARGAGVPHAVLVLDLDHFKAVNDLYGHLAGDQVLAAVAKALRSEVRDRDLVGRFGGEEFVILLVGQARGRRDRPRRDRGADPGAGRRAGGGRHDRGRRGADRASCRCRWAARCTPAGGLTSTGCCGSPTPRCTRRSGRAATRCGWARAQLLTLRDRPVAQDHPDVRPPSP